MKPVSILNILYSNKYNMAFTTLICIAVMFVFRNPESTMVISSYIAAPYLIFILSNDGSTNDFTIKNIFSITTIKYEAVYLIVAFLSALPLYILSLFIHSDIIMKIAMLIVYSSIYCLVAPILYKISTKKCGHKYELKHYAATISIVGISELAIYYLKQLTAVHSVASFVTIPLVCLSYILSLYLITIVNVLRNSEAEEEKMG